MASFTHAAQSFAPSNGRVKKIQIRVCVTDCTGIIHITDHPSAGRLDCNRMGRTRQ
jgi:hypothetical protein